ncbi:MAG: transketolase [Flavobacteriaceae bacterium]
MADMEALQKLVIQTRRDILRMVHKVNSGHPGGSLGCTEFFIALYHEVMELKDGFDMDGADEDVFFLSNGHISPVFYSTLARKGYFPIDELNTFRLIDSRLQGHPTTHEGLPGVRVASGSLGQGLSAAAGAALSTKLNHDAHLVYCLMGDGELQEGQNWEAIMFAAGNKVDNLIAIIDRNGQQIDGSTENVLPLGSVGDKFKAFGWEVLEISNGNNLEAVINGLGEAKSRSHKGAPICVVMNTVMGNGVDFMMHTHAWHGKAPNDEQLQIALAQNEETIGDY